MDIFSVCQLLHWKKQTPRFLEKNTQKQKSTTNYVINKANDIIGLIAITPSSAEPHKHRRKFAWLNITANVCSEIETQKVDKKSASE